MGNYILWGYNPDGINIEQEKLVQLPRRNSTWAQDDSNEQSLDELLAQPNFTESQLQRAQVSYKKSQPQFSRVEAIKNAPPEILEVLTELFNRIDTLELQINYYDLAHGKRKKPPRDTLLNKFTPAQQIALQEKALQWSQRTYLKQRHLLVELRREQYTYKDFYSSPITRHTTPRPDDEFEPVAANLCVLPLGLYTNTQHWLPYNELCKLNKIEPLTQDPTNSIILDLTNETTLQTLFSKLTVLRQEDDDLAQQLVKTLDYYAAQANLNEIRQLIYERKTHGYSNPQISAEIEQRFNRHYTPNYISTIYRQKILPTIMDTIEEHYHLLNAIQFKTAKFKTCCKCGRTYILNERHFGHKARSKDGFNSKCKLCEKEERAQRKEAK